MQAPDLTKFEKPRGDVLAAGAIVVGSVALLVVIAHVFRDVSAA